jgi:hypothetical protein
VTRHGWAEILPIPPTAACRWARSFAANRRADDPGSPGMLAAWPGTLTHCN